MAINKKYVLCCPPILALSHPTPKNGTNSVYSLPPVTFRRTVCRTTKEDKLQPVSLLPEGTNTHTNPKLWFKITQKHSHAHRTYGQPIQNTAYISPTNTICPRCGLEKKQPKPNRKFCLQPGE